MIVVMEKVRRTSISEQERAVVNILETARWIEKMITEKILQPASLERSEYMILRTLYEVQIPSTVEDITKETTMSPECMEKGLKGLLSTNFIQKEITQNELKYTLTKAGQNQIRALNGALAKHTDHFFENQFTPLEAKLINNVLERMRIS